MIASNLQAGFQTNTEFDVSYLAKVDGELLELLLRQADEHFRNSRRGPCGRGCGGGEVPRGYGGDAARAYSTGDGVGANLVNERH